MARRRVGTGVESNGDSGRPQLTRFEGKDVIKLLIVIKNTGDGLSQAMQYDSLLANVELHQGDKVWVTLECDVDEVSFPRVKGTEFLARKQVLRAGTATIDLDGDRVKRDMEAQRERIRKAKDAAKGVKALPFAAGDDGTDANGAAPAAAAPPAKAAPRKRAAKPKLASVPS